MKAWAAAAAALALSGSLMLGGCEHAQRLLVPALEASSPLGLYRAEAEEDVVYLTIDDGPSERTPEILAILEKHGATATFFVHTDGIEDPSLLARAVAEGHKLGHHMPSDRDWSKDPRPAFEAAFRESHCILAAYGDGYSGLFRPPRARANPETMLPVLAEAGLEADRPFVMATYLPWDAGGVTETRWRRGNALAAARYGRGLGRTIRPGEIVVFHDGPRSVRTEHTLKSLARFLDILDRRGLKARALPPAPYEAGGCEGG